MTDPLAGTISNLPEANTMHTGIVRSSTPLLVEWNQGNVIEPGVLGWYVPIVGDVVSLLRQGQTWLCLGRIRPGDQDPAADTLGIAAASVVGNAGNTTSGTFVAMPGPMTLTIHKRFDETALMFTVDVTYFASGGADAGGMFGMRSPGGVDVTCALLVVGNGTNGVRQALGGTGAIGGLSTGGIGAGLHTFTAVWGRFDGAGTMQFTATDWWSCAAQEYWQ